MCLAVPGQIVEIAEDEDPLLRSGRVRFGGIVKEINLAYTPEAGIEPDEAGLYFATLHREVMGPGLYEIQLQDDQCEVLASFPIEISSTP